MSDSQERARGYGIGAAMVGGGNALNRSPQDFYATPPNITAALFEAEAFVGGVWDPGCGDGRLLEVAKAYADGVYGSDLVDRGYGQEVRDFFDIPTTRAPNIVTNPPFDKAGAFIEHALSLRCRKVAFVLKANFWHAMARYGLYKAHPPSLVYPLTWRADFLGLGRPTLELIWCVWNFDHAGPTVYGPPLPRPFTVPTNWRDYAPEDWRRFR